MQCQRYGPVSFDSVNHLERFYAVVDLYAIVCAEYHHPEIVRMFFLQYLLSPHVACIDGPSNVSRLAFSPCCHTCPRCSCRCITELETNIGSRFTPNPPCNRVHRMRPSATSSACYDDPNDSILSRRDLSTCACMLVCLQVSEWEWAFIQWRHLWEKTG